VAAKNVLGHTLDHLGETIVCGRYAPGTALPPEPLLCEELGVSRTVVREALKSPAAKGMRVAGGAAEGDENGAMSSFWDQRFAEPGYKYGTAPNAFLREQAHRLPARARVLAPGDGEGRNSVWLAERGHRVQALDSSGVGLAKARALAAGRGVAIDTVQIDLADWRPEPGGAEAVVLIFTHLPSTLRRAVHRTAALALAPGGWLLLECFHPQQIGRPSGGPKDPDMLATLPALRADFAGLLDEVLAWDGETVLDEGPGHQGAARTVRYLGRRPASRP